MNREDFKFPKDKEAAFSTRTKARLQRRQLYLGLRKTVRGFLSEDGTDTHLLHLLHSRQPLFVKMTLVISKLTDWGSLLGTDLRFASCLLCFWRKLHHLLLLHVCFLVEQFHETICFYLSVRSVVHLIFVQGSSELLESFWGLVSRRDRSIVMSVPFFAEW